MRLSSRFFAPAFLLFIVISCQRSRVSPQGTAPPKPAEIITGAVTNIAADSATTGGTINPNDDTTAVLESGICYDSAHAPDITRSKLVKTVSSGSFSVVITYLKPATTYYVRAYMKKASGIVYGSEVSFVSARHPLVVGNSYFNGPVHTICSDPAGNIYAGGEFFHAYIAVDWFYVAKFNGSSWNELTGLKSSDYIRTLCSDPAGNIYSDERHLYNDVTIDVMRYGGSNWNTVGLYNTNNYYLSGLAADGKGNVYAIGTHQNTAGKYYIAQWGPGGYAELGAFDALPETICTDGAGNVYVAGLMNHGYNGAPGNFYIARWNGSTWSELGPFNDAIFSVCFDAGGNLIAGGAFNLDASGGIMSPGPFSNAGPQYYIAKWNGTSWSKTGNLPIYKNYGNYITQVCADKSGNIYITGDFKNAAGRYYVARWDGSNWSEIASFNDQVYSICTDPAGNIYAAGKFTDRNGQWYVAKCM